jgi:class 3 adenylate cyclase
MNTAPNSVAILFADVAGSTGLYQNHGDERALAAINRCLEVMQAITTEYRGQIVKTIGDELMAVFNSVDDAFCAACEMQWRVRDLPPCGSDQLAVRIGFNFGPALQRDNDVFGDSVNIAARLVDLAKPGQIITSGRVVEAMDSAHASHLRKLNVLTLRGTAQQETIFEALWQDGENITALISSVTTGRHAAATLLLRYRGTELRVEPKRNGVSLGRDQASDLVIASRKASRLHARIEQRRDKFILSDHSANGTYVTDEHGRETILRLEEMALIGRGMVAFGEPARAGDPGVLSFLCEADAGALPMDLKLGASRA